ncbi:MAG TPA: substrate-binding domain-containing protein [Anaeromyxobacter sp.]|nr:substrate-binding domain-containing protein [Anaeromyxobacter sp.]
MNRAQRTTTALLVLVGAGLTVPRRVAAEEYLVGFSQLAFTDPWRVAMNNQVEAAVRKHPELKLIIADGQRDNAKQVADVERFIQQRVDLLIISPNESAPLTAVVKRAYESGIPVIVLDRAVLGDAFTMFIGADNRMIGAKAGAYVARWCAERNRRPCNVLEVTGLSGSPPAPDRHSGFVDGIKANPDVRIVASPTSEWLKEKAVPAAAAAFQAHPDIDVVYGHNDISAEGAYIAARNADLDTEKMLFVGIDGLPDPDGSIASILQGRLGVSYVYPTGAAEAVEWAYRILTRGEVPPRKVVLGTEEITPDNARALCAKYHCPAR